MKKFKTWDDVSKFYTNDDKLTQETKHISVDGVEYIGHHEFLHGINWRLKSDVDHEKALLDGTVQPKSDEDHLWVIMHEEINKEINKEVLEKMLTKIKKDTMYE